jgi:hypothetical protein
MKTLFAFLLSCICASAAYNTITIVHTNIPATGDTITRGASAAIWTNGPFNTTSWIQTNGLAGSATNLTRFLAANHPAYYVRQQNSTNVLVSGADLTISITGTWGYLTTNSLAATNQWLVTLPFVQQFETNRTNTADELIFGLNAYARTGAFSAGAQALTNHFNRSTAQTGGNKTLTNSTFAVGIVTNSPLTNIPYANVTNLNAESAYVYALANTLTNASFQAARLTNATGKLTNTHVDTLSVNLLTVTNLNSPGAGAQSQAIGTNSVASGATSVAFGQDAKALGDDSVAIGYASSNYNSQSVAVGTLAWGTATAATAVGAAAWASAAGASAFGQAALSSNQYSTAIGANSRTTADYQMVLGEWGGTAPNVVIPGTLTVSGLFTPTNFIRSPKFSGTNLHSALTVLVPTTSTALVNGYNGNFAIATTTSWRKFSGPTGAYTNTGWLASTNGARVLLQFDNPGLSLAVLNDSGLSDSTNRIYTSSGGTILHSTNNPVFVDTIYDTDHWRVISFR